MNTKTNVKAGALGKQINHNQMTVKTTLKAGSFTQNHNQPVR